MNVFARFINRVLVAAGIRKPSPAPKLKLVGIDLRVGEPVVMRFKAEQSNGECDRPAERLGDYQDFLRPPTNTSNDLVLAALIGSWGVGPTPAGCHSDHEPQRYAVERESCGPSSSSDDGGSTSSSSYDSCSSSSDSSYSDSSSSSSCSSDY